MQQDGSSSIISATGTCRTFLEIFHNKSLVKKWSSFCPPRCWRALNSNLKIKVCINSVIMKVSFRPGYSSFTPPYDQLHLSGHSQHCSEKLEVLYLWNFPQVRKNGFKNLGGSASRRIYSIFSWKPFRYVPGEQFSLNWIGTIFNFSNLSSTKNLWV